MKIEVIKCDICKAEMDPDAILANVMPHRIHNDSSVLLCEVYNNGNKIPLDVCDKCADKLAKLIREIQTNAKEDKKEE